MSRSFAAKALHAAYRRIAVSPYRRIAVSPYRRVAVSPPLPRHDQLHARLFQRGG